LLQRISYDRYHRLGFILISSPTTQLMHAFDLFSIHKDFFFLTKDEHKELNTRQF